MLKKIFPSLATIVALPLAVSLVGGLTPAVYANGVPQVTNDLFRRSSEEFFREGERRFEREIQFLTNGILVSRDDLLKVDRQLQIQKDLLQLEKPSVLPKDSRPSKLKMPQKIRVMPGLIGITESKIPTLIVVEVRWFPLR